MFAPTKTWRRWHRKVNINQKRYAVVSALAASALPSLVLARGHRIEQVPEIPLVVDDSTESATKASKAVQILKAVGAYADAAKAKESRNIRRGKGKMRNRRYVNRKGPLVVYGNDNGISQAFRNLPGVDVVPVTALNLLQLAPGGHLGRFIVWTKSAFAQLDTIFGTAESKSEVKKGYKLPRAPMTNSDLTRLINSDEIQSVVRPKKDGPRRRPLKKNPLRNLGALLKLNPYAKAARRAALLQESRQQSEKAKEAKKAKLREIRKSEHKTVAKTFYKQMIQDSDYVGEDYEVFSNWLGQTQKV
jgi:large subunit ribosomal protein L4e